MGIASQHMSVQERRYRQIASLVSLGVSVALLMVKMLAYNLTHSQAILSDAMESIVNVVAASMALWVIWYSSRPADTDHPYGHGKVEFFSAAFEGGLISFAALLIVWEAGKALYEGKVPQNLNVGVALLAVAGLVNLFLGIYLVQAGKKWSSVALKASGAHVISDFWTSAGVVVGLGIAELTGFLWMDPAIAIAVGVWLGFNGFSIVRESVGALMDREDLGLLRDLAIVFEKNRTQGIIQIHHVKVIRSGWYHHIDAHVVMPEFWDVKRVHRIINEFEQNVINSYEFGGEMNFHLDPCGRAYCRNCDLADCPIRQEEFVEKIPVKVEHLRSPVEPAEYRKRRD